MLVLLGWVFVPIYIASGVRDLLNMILGIDNEKQLFKIRFIELHKQFSISSYIQHHNSAL